MALPVIALGAAVVGGGAGAYFGYKTTSTVQRVTSIAGIAAVFYFGLKLAKRA